MHRKHLLVLLLALLPLSNVAAQTYQLDRQSLSSTGGELSSGIFENQVTVGQFSVAGASSSCNAGYWTSTGFWGVLDNLPVPLFLSVSKSTAIPGDLTLQWTGTASSFDIYRGISPTNIDQPANFWVTSSACQTDQFQGSSNYYFDIQNHN